MPRASWTLTAARSSRTADIQALGDKSAKELEKVFDVVVRLSGIDEDMDDEIGKAKDAMVEDPTSRLKYYVAHELHMPVAEMLSRMTWQEFINWCGYFAKRNEDQELADSTAGVASQVSSQRRGK